jgi:hypothetical protein
VGMSSSSGRGIVLVGMDTDILVLVRVKTAVAFGEDIVVGGRWP